MPVDKEALKEAVIEALGELLTDKAELDPLDVEARAERFLEEGDVESAVALKLHHMIRGDEEPQYLEDRVETDGAEDESEGGGEITDIVQTVQMPDGTVKEVSTHDEMVAAQKRGDWDTAAALKFQLMNAEHDAERAAESEEMMARFEEAWNAQPERGFIPEATEHGAAWDGGSDEGANDNQEEAA